MVWIVEAQWKHDGAWYPTVGAALSKPEAIHKLHEWQRSNPADQFRLARYVRKEAP